MFPNKDWKRNALKVITDTTGTIDRRPDSGRPRTVCTTAIIHQVEDLALSQEGKLQTHRTDRQKGVYREICHCVLCVCGFPAWLSARF